MSDRSPVTNRRDPSVPRPKLVTERVRLYAPAAEWTYSHHASVAFFKGRFYAVWSNGWIDEDAPGQRVLISSSADFHNWSAPVPLVDAAMGRSSELVLTAAGFHQHNGTLAVYIGQYEYSPDVLEEPRRIPSRRVHIDTTLRVMTTADGRAWSGLRDLHLPIVPNHGPQPTSTGRLIISGNISFPWTDDPAGLEGWTMTGLYPAGAAGIVDDSSGYWPACHDQGWDFSVCEGSFFETDDHVLHMLLRTGNNLRESVSRDNGATWSFPRLTHFTDCSTKFHCGRLPDGRCYVVSCPDPGSGRCPLVLALSDDGVSFGRALVIADEPYTMQREGRHKNGIYGYPHTMIHDGSMYVIFSMRKEAVDGIRFSLDQL